MPLALGVNTTAIGSLGVTGASGYSLSLVQFTGGDTYLSRGANLTGLGDSGSFTMSVWLRFDNADEDGSTRGIFANEQTTGDFLIRAIGTNFLQGIAYGPTVQVIARNSVAANYQTSSGLFHLLCAFDRTSNNVQYWFNGANDRDIGWNNGTEDVDFSAASDWWIGADNAGTNIGEITMADFWFDDTYLDPTDADNLAKFITAAGGPVDLGGSGELPTGSAPLIFLQGPAASFATNKGTGGNFSVSGTGLADA